MDSNICFNGMSMKEYKILQDVYHKTAEIGDYTNDSVTVLELSTGDLVESILNHFTKEQPELIYPTKSYFVAIIYTTLLEKHFHEPFYTALNDPELLYGNDKFFVPYSEARLVYDTVIRRLPWFPSGYCGFNDSLSQVASTIDYFNKEFGIELEKDGE